MYQGWTWRLCSGECQRARLQLLLELTLLQPCEIWCGSSEGGAVMRPAHTTRLQNCNNVLVCRQFQSWNKQNLSREGWWDTQGGTPTAVRLRRSRYTVKGLAFRYKNINLSPFAMTMTSMNA